MARRRSNPNRKPLWSPGDARKRRGHNVPARSAVTSREHQKLRDDVGSYRDAPFSLSVDAHEWLDNCPEDLNLSVSGATGALQFDLSKAKRRPLLKEMYTKEGKRRPDFYAQSTEPFRFDLGCPDTVDALREMLRRIVAFAATLESEPRFRMEIGEERELWRRRVPLQYTAADRTVRTDADSVETLVVTCDEGERPSRFEVGMKQLQYGSKEYIKLRDEWAAEAGDHGSKRYTFRIRRRTSLCQPAWDFTETSDFSIRLEAVPALARRLPAWWEIVFRQHLDESRRETDQRFRRLDAKDPDPWRRGGDEERGSLFWISDLAAKRLTLVASRYAWSRLGPRTMRRICRWVPQPGLFDAESWTDSRQPCIRATDEPFSWCGDVESLDQIEPLYLYRLLLWASGAVQWQHEWGPDELEARVDLERVQAIQKRLRRRLVYVTLLGAIARLCVRRQRREATSHTCEKYAAETAPEPLLPPPPPRPPPSTPA